MPSCGRVARLHVLHRRRQVPDASHPDASAPLSDDGARVKRVTESLADTEPSRWVGMTHGGSDHGTVLWAGTTGRGVVPPHAGQLALGLRREAGPRNRGWPCCAPGPGPGPGPGTRG